MRLREGRDWGLLFMPMVKLVSWGCGVAGVEIVDVGGCCTSWKWRRRRPNVRSARSGRAGLSRKRRCIMSESWSAVSVGSMNLMLSMCGRRGTWSKWDGFGWAHICWWIWKAALRRSFQALRTYVVVMAPKPCRVLVSRESAAEDRQGFCLVLALAVSASELTSGEVKVPCHSGSR